MASIIGVSTGSPAYGFRPRGTLISLSLRVFFSPLSLSRTRIFFVLLFYFFFFRAHHWTTNNAVDGKREARGCVQREGVRSWRSCTSRRWNRIRLSTPRCRSWGDDTAALAAELFVIREIWNTLLLPPLASLHLGENSGSALEFRRI